MKFLASILLFFSVINTFGQTNESYCPLIQNIGDRKIQSLNGQWNRLVDPLESGYYTYRKKVDPDGFFKDPKVDNWMEFKEYGFDEAPTHYIPGDWNTQDPKLYYYEGTVWYKRAFNYTGSSARQFLYFGAANYDAKVYLNGEKVGEHLGGYTPFNMEVTKYLKKGENSLIVKVDNKRKKEAVPTDNFDWWNYGGITRDVNLVEMPASFVVDYKLQLKKGSKTMVEGYVKIDGITNAQKLKLEIPELKITKELLTDASGKVVFEINTNPVLWSPTNPKLYKVKIISQNDINSSLNFLLSR